MDGRPRPSDLGTRRLGLVAGCALAASVAVLLYLPTIGFGFVYDDVSIVTTHPQVTGHDWGGILTSPYHVGPAARVATGLYRPLTIATIAANHVVSGLEPWSYHLLNVALHAMAAALVVVFARKLGGPPTAALLAGLAFAVHPVHVEVVANVAGRAELLSTVFALGALIASMHGRLAAFAMLLGAALLAKENAVTIFGVVAFWEASRPATEADGSLSSRVRRALKPLAVAALPIAAYLAARFAVLSGLGVVRASVTPIENPVMGLSPLPHAATVLAVFSRAASLVVTPVRLAPDYGYAEITPSSSFLEAGPLVGGILLVGLVALIVFSWRRAPLVAFLIGAALGTYAIASNAFVLIGTVLADRLLYLPSVFACILFGLAASAAARYVGPRAAAAGAGLILVALAARSATYASVWREDATLFEYAARVTPRSVRALGGWGEILAERGQLDDARAVLDRAIAIAPDFIPNRLNRAAAAFHAGDFEAAETDVHRVLALDPGNAAAKRLLSAMAASER